jgi:hypothetical protein
VGDSEVSGVVGEVVGLPQRDFTLLEFDLEHAIFRLVENNQDFAQVTGVGLLAEPFEAAFKGRVVAAMGNYYRHKGWRG